MLANCKAELQFFNNFYDKTLIERLTNLADSDFGGYNCLDAFAVLNTITEQEVRVFIRENLTPERFAMSVITPSESGKGGDADA